MKNEPVLLDKIIGLTSLRDVELLEFSLLQTIQDYLKPRTISLVKVNKRGQPLSLTEFNQESCQVHYENITLSQPLQSAIQQFESSQSHELATQLDKDHVLTLYLLEESNHCASFLTLETKSCSTPNSSYLVSGFIQIYRNFCSLLAESQTDELTGLANRKTFEEYILKLYEQPVSFDENHPNNARLYGGKNYWLAIIDIDNFKTINDTFGHLYGDEVLLVLAQQLKTKFREDDAIFRFGGEEFVVILRAPDRDACHQILERLRESIAEHTFPGVGHITISIGAHQISADTFYVTLLDYADKALYHSKKSGRNRITFFEDMVANGLAKYEAVESGTVDLF
ncbi:GGDEF domain-containing protein [Halioxenophilus sp. WMMB6]|uniref:GGDEF domain-containing protein n=1 Tax=Halioxenophilus sp. WMMB6 TaxID=3073815 RepID=UPI00295E38A3|nr:GGDEF domain-containing protein [Halioxenophilus sp. WMMB6]